jgi:glycosyltransferase involved in cell wall biosynthesis
VKPVYDETMNAAITWDIPLLEGYQYRFMTNISPRPYSAVFGRVNPGLVWHLLTNRYDAVFLQGFMYMTNWLALLLAKLTRTSIIFRGEGTLKAYNVLSAKELPKRLFVRAADRVLYTCTGNQVWLAAMGVNPDTMCLSPCSVDNDFFRQQQALLAASTHTPRQQLGLAEHIVYVISVARMHPRKRLLDLVAAVAMLQQAGLPIGLVLIGDGPERGCIEQRVQELALQHVHLPGFVNMSKLGIWLAASDMFVLTSEFDPSPKSLSEALNFSLPILCTDVVGTAQDLVHAGKNGFHFPVGDVQRLAEHLRWLVEHPDMRHQMGAVSRNIADAWSMQATARSVVEAVHDLVELREAA